MTDTTRKKPAKGAARSNEEEYFARREAELLRQHRDAMQRRAAEAERKSHHLKCPKCGFGVVTIGVHHVEIDQCPNCLGLWLDADETEAMLKASAKRRGEVRMALLSLLKADGAHEAAAAAAEHDYFTRRAESLARQQRAVSDQAAAAAERRSHWMKCPKCGFDLLTTEVHAVDIDQCPHCHGVWFDAGEAEQMLKRTEAERGVLRSALLSIVKAVSGARAKPE
jgi:hypothetical protein